MQSCTNHEVLYQITFHTLYLMLHRLKDSDERKNARTESARRLTCHLTETAHKFILTIECVLCAFVCVCMPLCHCQRVAALCVRLNSPPSTTAIPFHDKIWNNAALNKVREERVDDVCRCESHFSTSHNSCQPTDRTHNTLATTNRRKIHAIRNLNGKKERRRQHTAKKN